MATRSKGRIASSTPLSKSNKPNSKSSAGKECVCPICEEIVEDSSNKKKGQESILCEGACNTWLHRRCAGLSKKAFQLAANSNDQFFCPHCCLTRQNEEIKSLRAAVDVLTAELSEVKSLLKKKSDGIGGLHVDTSSSPVSRKVSHSNPVSGSVVEPQVSPSTTMQGSRAMMSTQALSRSTNDKRFNLVVYRVSECPKGTKLHDRITSDLEEVTSVVRNLDASINPESICDCHRLGKFVPNSRPRPILVKLSRTREVFSILSKRGSLHAPYNIKPDMTPKQRETEAMLLRERWNLIVDGTPRNYIKIRNQSLYVSGKLHARVVNSKLEHLIPQNTATVQSEGSPAALSAQDNNSPASSGTPPVTTSQVNSSQVNVNVLPASD